MQHHVLWLDLVYARGRYIQAMNTPECDEQAMYTLAGNEVDAANKLFLVVKHWIAVTTRRDHPGAR
jgi:hypothetical protein